MRILDKHIIGIAFWIGGAVISIINIIKILVHTNTLLYDYIMTGIAVIFIIFSLILLRKKNKGDNLNKLSFLDTWSLAQRTLLLI